MSSKNNSNVNSKIISSDKNVLAIIFAVGVSIFIFLFAFLKQIQDSQSIGIDPVPGPDNKLEVFISNNNGENIPFKLEVADEPKERAEGLMARTDIEDNEGMLFIFNDSAERSFWMKNTPTSLDILFFDENFNLITLHESTIPNNTEILYPSGGDAMYVVELKAGTANNNSLVVGSKLSLNI